MLRAFLPFVMFPLLFPLMLRANSFSSEQIALELKEASYRHDIDKRIVYTLAKIESNFNPLVIAFVSNEDKYEFKNLKKGIRKYPKDRYVISFRGSEKELKKALKVLLKDKSIKVDVGLMQINSSNFKEDEIDNIFNLKYNIEKSLSIFKRCINAKSTLQDSVECYNKGLRKKVNYDYYTRFKNSFNKDFAFVE